MRAHHHATHFLGNAGDALIPKGYERCWQAAGVDGQRPRPLLLAYQ